jgi:hypothetical protein
MEGRTIALAVAALGWLIASLIAFAFVFWFGFAGIGVMGLVIWFVCIRMELEKDAAVSSGWAPELIVHQQKARDGMSEDERMSRRHEQSLAMQSVRFFRHLGMGLTVIGAAGFLYFQL